MYIDLNPVCRGPRYIETNYELIYPYLLSFIDIIISIFWIIGKLIDIQIEPVEIIGNWLRLCLLISISKIIIQISRNYQYRTFWGPLLVCDDGWGSEEAQVACR